MIWNCLSLFINSNVCLSIQNCLFINSNVYLSTVTLSIKQTNRSRVIRERMKKTDRALLDTTHQKQRQDAEESKMSLTLDWVFALFPDDNG